MNDGWHISSGVKFHLKDEMIHNLEGPAVVHSDGYVEWCINDVHYSKQDWLKEVRK